jgi:hypothetical protein
LAEQIDLGRISAAIGTFAIVPPRFKASLLFEYDDVLIANSSQTAHDAMTIAALSERSLAVVSFGGDQEGAVSPACLTALMKSLPASAFEDCACNKNDEKSEVFMDYRAEELRRSRRE